MIDLYAWPTPNAYKVSIMLEETGLPYNVVPVNITAGEQFEPAFLKISPNNRMPAIVDNDVCWRAAVGLRVGRDPDVSGGEDRTVLAAGAASALQGRRVGDVADGRAGADAGPGRPFQDGRAREDPLCH